MVPAPSLQHLVHRNHAAHGATTAAAIRCDDVVVTPPPREPTRYMAQEPINHQQHHEPPKPPPQQPQPREADDHRIQDDHRREPPPTQNHRLQLQLGRDGHQQEADETSGSSSDGSSSNGGGGGGNNGARDWLRLGLGPGTTATTGPASPGASGSDLDLFPSDNRTTTTAPPPPPPRHQDVLVLPGMPPGAFLRPGPAMPGIPQASIPPNMPRAAPPWLPPWSPAAANAPTQPPLLPFAHHRAFYAAPAPAPASSGFHAIRVVLPPSAVAATAGVWFVLQAAPHQGREPFLPQIPRSYLRIKDGRVTVRLLTKYLVNKLGLEDESEVEITCRGRQLLPILTLQHVRDSIWCQRDAVSPSAAPDISTADHHIMILQYGRRP